MSYSSLVFAACRCEMQERRWQNTSPGAAAAPALGASFRQSGLTVVLIRLFSLPESARLALPRLAPVKPAARQHIAIHCNRSHVLPLTRRRFVAILAPPARPPIAAGFLQLQRRVTPFVAR
jgi:hypothetical protein